MSFLVAFVSSRCCEAQCVFFVLNSEWVTRRARLSGRAQKSKIKLAEHEGYLSTSMLGSCTLGH